MPQRTWVATQKTDDRARHGAAFLTARDGIALFGGRRGSLFLDDLVFLWPDGGTSPVDGGVGPSPREFPSFAEDRVANRVLLFGGATSGGPQGDTWTFDGARWTSHATAGPQARTEASAAYEPSSRKVVLFGGLVSAASSAELWEWSGGAWAIVAPTSPWPPARAGATLTSADGRVLLFGGRDGATELSDLWEWNGSRWLMLAANGPRRTNHMAGWDPLQHALVVWGGSTQDDSVWEWRAGRWRVRGNTAPSTPALRRDSTFEWFPPIGQFVLIGGSLSSRWYLR